MAAVETIEALERIYGDLGAVGEASTTKVADHITPDYGRFIAVAPFVALATVGPEGLDCSPRGDVPGFVRIADPRTLILPDRRGNNRIDSLRKVVRDPRVGLMVLIPGVGNALRVNGRAVVEDDPALLATFAVDGKAPRTALVITVGEVYFQCARPHSLRPVARGQPRRPEDPADARPDPGRAQRRPGRRRRLRCGLGQAGAADDVVTAGQGSAGPRGCESAPRLAGLALMMHQSRAPS